MTFTYLRDVLTNKYAVGASAEVGRVFMICAQCRRVVPAWQLVSAKVKPGDKIGCKCGTQNVRPAIISEWRAAYWVITSFLVRRVIRRERDYDPRLPWRQQRIY